ncbi:unnamed protein product [Penicillium egyptiacum]|uniref:F-box domain-containing protein n=1 Tax=Penicillium egyptiacum TaxID=1303716 RepID=A0A9W4K9E1_9EURO|nr:unnamed protein product [Penicillium egyptiacum]
MPSGLSRLAQSHPDDDDDYDDDDEEYPSLLGGGKKMICWINSWRLPVPSKNIQTEKQQMSRKKYTVWRLCTKISSISSILSLSTRQRFTRNRPAILSLQESVLHNIYKHLPLVDKACLSLSCKRLFNLFRTILKEKEFEFPRLLHLQIPILL